MLTNDSIYIRTFPVLVQVMKLRDTGSLEPEIRIFISRKLYRMIENNEWDKLGAQIHGKDFRSWKK